MRIVSIRTQDPIIELGTKSGFTTLTGTGNEHVDSIERVDDAVLITWRGKTVAYPWAKTSGAVVVMEKVSAEQKELLGGQPVKPAAATPQPPPTTQLPEGQLTKAPTPAPTPTPQQARARKRS